MYVCPFCGRGYEVEERMRAHYLNCWKELHPSHVSHEAPHSEDKETRIMGEDAISFFSCFGKEQK